MANENKKIFIYCSGIDTLMSESAKIYGILVQMSFWAMAFAQNGWEVYSYTDKHTGFTDKGIHFVPQDQSSLLSKLHLDIVAESMQQFLCLFRYKPDVILFRGASRALFLLSLLSKMFRCKFVFFGASDSDFDKGKEIVGGGTFNKKLYHQSLKKIPYIVVQNQIQHDRLFQIYGKESLVLSNLWIPMTNIEGNKVVADAIFVSNLRSVKRAEWFVGLAEKLPHYHFMMVGGAEDQSYYDEILSKVRAIKNIDFCGAQPFYSVTKRIAQSRILVCTSLYEGFPNTFLQAWSNHVPVVSTVDPSGVIQRYGLGAYVNTEDQLQDLVLQLLTDEVRYNACRSAIKAYFEKHHSAQQAYQKLINYIKEENSINPMLRKNE